MRCKRLLFFFILCTPLLGQGQDPQYSQFYAAPLYLNPAFAGSSQLTRVGANYRSQWPSLEASYVTYAAWADHFIDDKNSGVGFLVSRDNVTLSGLVSTLISAQYSYQLPISSEYTVRFGMQGGYTLRNIDYSNLIFGDQIGTGGVIGPTMETLSQSGAKNYFDVGAGALLFSKSAWLGFSALHLNQPNQTIDGGSSPLPRKYSAHVGYKFFFSPGVVGQGLFARPQERSVAPTIQYKFQGPFDQLDVGLYFTYDPLITGIWYRGVPFKAVDGFGNNEAIVLLVGFNQVSEKEIFSIGYSYDITLSNLGAASGGAHEFSIQYAWFTGDPRKPPKNARLIPCPNF